MHKEQVYYAWSSLSNTFINGLESSSLSNAKSLLILKEDEIGDMLYTLHVIEACTEEMNAENIEVVCKKMNHELVHAIDSKIQTHTKFPLKKEFDIVLDLRSSKVNMWRGMKTAKYRRDRGTVRLYNKLNGGQKHEVYTNWDVLKPLLSEHIQFRFPKIKISKEHAHFAENLVKDAGSYCILHAGARSQSRRWPIERFKAMATFVAKEYGLTPVLVGGPSDINVTNTLSESMEQISHINLAGKTSLLELASLCQKASLFIGNESGPLHFANIQNTPLIALFGPGVKDVFYPYHKQSVILHHLNAKNSITKISIEELQSAARKLLA